MLKKQKNVPSECKLKHERCPTASDAVLDNQLNTNKDKGSEEKSVINEKGFLLLKYNSNEICLGQIPPETERSEKKLNGEDGIVEEVCNHTNNNAALESVDNVTLNNSDQHSQTSSEKYTEGSEQASLLFHDNSDSLKTIAARPVPRKRLSVPYSVIESDLSSKREDQLDLSEVITHSERSISKKEPEYSEVYVTQQNRCGVTASQSTIENDDTTLENFDRCDWSSHKDRFVIVNPYSTIDEPDEADDIVDERAIKLHNENDHLTGQGKSFSHEEPEATCDMLKEIEALLSSKLNISDETECLNNDCIIESVASSKVVEISPKRPPRPKKEASRQRSKTRLENRSLSVDSASSHSLSSVDLSSTSSQSLVNSELKKVPPQKPKRTTLPRVNRSQSDVSGMRDAFSNLDSSSAFTSNTSLNTESEKPVLPPRSESLRKSHSTLSDIPPPLPPRNKPCSPITTLSKNRSGANLQSSPHRTITTSICKNMSNPKLSSKSENNPPTPGQDITSPAVESNSKTGTLSQSQIEGVSSINSGAGSKKLSARQRPLRKAPPPPSAKPKKKAGFNPENNGNSSDSTSLRYFMVFISFF